MNNGCQHTLKEWILSQGSLSIPPFRIKSCDGTCSVCNGEWQQTYLPIYKDSMIQFIESSTVSNAMPTVATHDSLTNLLSKENVWINKKFDKAKSTVARHNIESTLLQLIATEIITIKHHREELYWHINCIKDKHNPYADKILLHLDDSSWKGISLSRTFQVAITE